MIRNLNLHFYDQNYILSAAYKINDDIKDCHVHYCCEHAKDIWFLYFESIIRKN